MSSEPDKEAIGLVCDDCECSHFYVIWTRPRANGLIARRRECRNCGRPKTTVEKEIDPKVTHV